METLALEQRRELDRVKEEKKDLEKVGSVMSCNTSSLYLFPSLPAVVLCWPPVLLAWCTICILQDFDEFMD